MCLTSSDGLTRRPDAVDAQEEKNGETDATHVAAAAVASDRPDSGSLHEPKHVRPGCESQPPAQGYETV